MKLRDLLTILAGIGDDATRILHKKVGKTKGLDAIEKQIRDKVEGETKKATGGVIDRVAQIHIDRYVSKRMGYMKKAFTKLDNPQTDTSKKRGDFIGDTETKSAKAFGETKGYERLAKTKKKNIYKSWVTGDNPCSDCIANEAEGPIPVGDMYPSGDYSPQAHPGCDCDQEFTDDDGNET